MKKYCFLVNLIFLFLCIPLFNAPAQVVDENQEYVEETPNKSKEEKPLNRFFYGGNFGFSINPTDLQLSPIVGYNLTKRFQLAVGPDYEYYYYRDIYEKYSFNIFGGRVFGRYFIFKNIFAHVEDEILSVNDKILGSTDNSRQWLNSFLVGGGYRQMIGDRSSFNITILWDFGNAKYSITSNPVIKFDFNF